jgi:hypothetical protein
MMPMLAELARRNIEEGAASLRAARDAGVKIALGSDVSLGTAAGIQLMIRHGLTPPRRPSRPRPALPPRHWTWPNTSAPWQRARSPTC